MHPPRKKKIKKYTHTKINNNKNILKNKDIHFFLVETPFSLKKWHSTFVFKWTHTNDLFVVGEKVAITYIEFEYF